ncbi:MAG TPA: chitobiase/beta-hexosaminidase C-terminal domain-containing protein [Candidatus Cloacimonadota bacterium]|nr:chitobiase/beta-hexosaminidase C-terminal domain-containing protein [Candidatus Cloacimonadota bacterium]
MDRGCTSIHGMIPSPIFDPPGGSYSAALNVEISCIIPEATIRFTTDGSEPLPDSHLYSVPIQILESTVVTARAYRNGWLSSGISSAEYIITGTVALPTFDPPPGNYETSQSVAIICSTPGATIYYTTDGSDPVPESEMYHTPLNISQTTTIKARAYLMNWATSPISLATYGLPVELPDAQHVPSISEILQIYPNPFRDDLTVKLSVTNLAESYQFKVYNLKGECLHTQNGRRNGVFEIAWDGKDSRGQRLPSGVYLLRLITGTEISTRKVVIR